MRNFLKYLLLSISIFAIGTWIYAQTPVIGIPWELLGIDAVSGTSVTGNVGIGTRTPTFKLDVVGNMRGVYTEVAPAVDGTRYFQYTANSSSDPAATAEVTSLYGSYNWTAGTNGVFIANGVEGVVRSRANDEAGTFRGGYFRTYIDTDTDPNASMRTSVGAEISARASHSGGPEAIAEPGTAFIGSRIWMAPYFTDASIPNINNSHALWILNETPNGGAWGKYIDRAITVDATTYGSGFNYNFYSDTGKFYMYLDGTKAGSGVVSGERSTASGDDWMHVRVSDYRTFTSNQVYNGAFFRYDVRSTVPGAPQYEVRGLEAVGSTYVADGNLLSLFGAVLRTFIQPGIGPSAKTSIGAEISARASFNGGADCEALPGTAFVGARIYMAPYFTLATLGNINNFWGLWIFGEHATQRNADAAIKISTAGGGFTEDLILQRGTTITDIAAGLRLTPPTGQVLFPDGVVAAPSLAFINSTGTGFWWDGTYIRASNTGANIMYLNAAVLQLTSPTIVLGNDTAIIRDGGANILAQKTGNFDQTQRWYGANDSYFQIATQSELLTILAAGSTDTTMTIPANAIVRGVAVYVVTVIPAPATTFTVTGATSTTVFNTVAVGVGAGSNDVGTQNTPFKNGAAQLIRITPDAIPGAATGQVRIVLFYEIPSPPTS